MSENINTGDMDDNASQTSDTTQDGANTAAAIVTMQQQLTTQAEMMTTLMARLELADKDRSNAEKKAIEAEKELKQKAVETITSERIYRRPYELRERWRP